MLPLSTGSLERRPPCRTKSLGVEWGKGQPSRQRQEHESTLGTGVPVWRGGHAHRAGDSRPARQLRVQTGRTDGRKNLFDGSERVGRSEGCKMRPRGLGGHTVHSRQEMRRVRGQGLGAGVTGGEDTECAAPSGWAGGESEDPGHGTWSRSDTQERPGTTAACGVDTRQDPPVPAFPATPVWSAP